MKKILIAGEGGQGVQSVAEILALAADKSGKFTSYIPNFGVEQRGGVSLAFLQIDDQAIGFPRFSKADIIAVMCSRAVGHIKKFISEETYLIFDNSFIDDETIQELNGLVKNYLALPAKNLAQENGSLKIANMIVLGAVSAAFDLGEEIIKQSLTEKFKDHPEFNDLNLKAFDLGKKYAQDRPNQEFKGLSKTEVKELYEDEVKSWQRFPQYCKGCGLCLEVCPQKALKFSNDLNFLGTNTPEVDLEKCIACGKCQKICPDGAIKVTKKN